MTYTVEHFYSGKTTDHYRVMGGKPGAQPVRVRVGEHGRWACLTCLTADTCEHSRAAREYAESLQHAAATRAAPVAAEAAA